MEQIAITDKASISYRPRQFLCLPFQFLRPPCVWFKWISGPCSPGILHPFLLLQSSFPLFNWAPWSQGNGPHRDPQFRLSLYSVLLWVLCGWLYLPPSAARGVFSEDDKRTTYVYSKISLSSILLSFCHWYLVILGLWAIQPWGLGSRGSVRYGLPVIEWASS